MKRFFKILILLSLILSAVSLAACTQSKKHEVTFNANGGKYISGETEQIINHGSGASAPVFYLKNYALSWDKAFGNITEESLLSPFGPL